MAVATTANALAATLETRTDPKRRLQLRRMRTCDTPACAPADYPARPMGQATALSCIGIKPICVVTRTARCLHAMVIQVWTIPGVNVGH